MLEKVVMVSTRSLLNRLRSEPPPLLDQHASHDSDTLRNSICENLRRILNSRAGMSQACPTYGIPDFSQIVSGVPERARDVEDALRKCILEFEPRIHKVEVTHVPDAHGPMTACFMVRASVKSGRGAEEVRFETLVVSSGRVELT